MTNPEILSMIKKQHSIDNNAKWVGGLALGVIIIGGIAYYHYRANQYKSYVISKIQSELEKERASKKSLITVNNRLTDENAVQKNIINSLKNKLDEKEQPQD